MDSIAKLRVVERTCYTFVRKTSIQDGNARMMRVPFVCTDGARDLETQQDHIDFSRCCSSLYRFNTSGTLTRILVRSPTRHRGTPNLVGAPFAAAPTSVGAHRPVRFVAHTNQLIWIMHRGMSTVRNRYDSPNALSVGTRVTVSSPSRTRLTSRTGRMHATLLKSDF